MRTMRSNQRLPVWSVLFVCLLTSSATGGDAGEQEYGLEVRLPAGVKAKSAVAVAPSLKLETAGTVAADGVLLRFDKLLPDTAYDVRVDLADGTVLQGVDLGWYNEETSDDDADGAAGDERPADPGDEEGDGDGAGRLTDEAREQIRAIVADVPRFYNKCEVLALRGDDQRATALVRLVRDKEFYADKGGEIIWRIELWYFKNQFGGWEAVAQQNKVLRRERFRDRRSHDAVAGRIKWVPDLGGLRVSDDEPRRTVVVNLPAAAGK